MLALYTPEGVPTYYSDGSTIYGLDGVAYFYINDANVYRHSDGKCCYWISDGWVFEKGEHRANARYYFGEKLEKEKEVKTETDDRRSRARAYRRWEFR